MSSGASDELVLESSNFCAETSNEIDVLGDMVVHIEGIAGGVRLDVFRAVGVLQRVERFFERRRGSAIISRCARAGDNDV